MPFEAVIVVFIEQLIVCVAIARKHCCCSFAVIQRGKVIATIIVVFINILLAILDDSFLAIVLKGCMSLLFALISVSRKKKNINTTLTLLGSPKELIRSREKKFNDST